MTGSALLDATLESTAWTAALLAARVLPMVVLLPFFGGLAASPTVRGGAAITLMIAFWPATLVAAPPGAPEQLLAIASQLAVGLLTGLALLFVVESARVIGGAADTALGRGSFGAADPLGAGASGPMATLHAMGFVAVFMASGSHIVFLSGVDLSLDTFALDASLDVDSARASVLAAVRMLSAAFSVAVALALPALGVGLVVDVSLGWLGRTMPQLPILFVAMPLRMVLGWTVIAATLAGTMMWLVEVTIGALAAMTDTLP
jgi:flagellar biosynthetic protein FliR